ncbi:MAG: glycosyltransferase, partial [Sphingomicrobium sp.]
MAKQAAQAKRIAIFLPNMAGGGAERVVLASARDLVARGHRVDLVLISAGGELLSLVPPEVRVIDLKQDRFRSALFPLARYLRAVRPDALHAVMWPSTVIAILAHRLARSKARLMVSDQVALSGQVTAPLQRAILKATTRLLYPLADVRVVCSAAAADDLAHLSGFARDRFEVITNPTEPPAAIATNPRVEALWGEGRPRIITIGSLKD